MLHISTFTLNFVNDYFILEFSQKVFELRTSAVLKNKFSITVNLATFNDHMRSALKV